MSKNTKDCCPVLTLVLSRMPERSKVSMRYASGFNLKTGRATGPVLIFDFPRGKNKDDEFRNSTYAPVSFCPFCGAKLGKER